MSFEWVEIGELQAKKNGSIDPSKFLDETFELYSIPSHDKGNAEILAFPRFGPRLGAHALRKRKNRRRTRRTWIFHDPSQ